MLLKIGGHTWQGSLGIHGRHLDEGARIRYISIDDQRQVIPVVYYTNDQDKTIEYVSSNVQATKQQLDTGEHRSMDCVDCHNRPTHAFELPENAVNQQMSNGRISPELPYIRKKAVELLKADYPDRDVAQQRIVEGVKSFYRTNYPTVYDSRRAFVEQAAQSVADIYLRNIFPAMKVNWGGCTRTTSGTRISLAASVVTTGATPALTARRLPTIAPPATICWLWRKPIPRS